MNKDPDPILICITGIDGVGKTTQAKLILEHLQNSGLKCRYEWFRFHHLISLPLLAICRIAGYTRTSNLAGKNCSYHEFHKSMIVSLIYPWLLLIDTSLFAVVKIFIPMRLGSNIVCDRYIYDTLIDLCVAIKDFQIYKKRVGKLFLNLIPKNSRFIILCLDKQEIIARRPELIEDATFDERHGLYRLFIDEFQIDVVFNDKSINEVNESIIHILIGERNGSQ